MNELFIILFIANIIKINSDIRTTPWGVELIFRIKFVVGCRLIPASTWIVYQAKFCAT